MNFFYIFIILFILFLIFINLSKFTNSETTANGSSKVFIFYSNQCGYCVRAMPEFKKASDKNSDIQLIDASKPGNRPLVVQYEIKGYPTIIKEDGTKFSGNRTADEILKFAAS